VKIAHSAGRSGGAGTPHTLDTSTAEAYERLIAGPLNSEIAQRAVAHGAPRPGARVLDVACGTGIVLRTALPSLSPGGFAAGVDADAAMIEVARNVVSAPTGVQLEWHCASAQDMPLEDASFDLVLCVQGIQYFPDAAAAVAEMRRVTRSGGRIVAAMWSSLEECKGQHALARALKSRDVDPAAILKAYSWGSAERLCSLVSGAGFEDVQVEHISTRAHFPSVDAFLDAFAVASLSSRAAIAKVAADQRVAFMQEICSELSDYVTADDVALPLGCLIVGGRG
jgi:ubiquinone/menaquinone biosynthesis C-methylase UbiE